MQSETRGTIFCSGIGCGKTLMLCNKAICKALIGKRSAIVSFAYRQLTDVAFTTAVKQLPKFGLEPELDYSINRSDMFITIRGSQILFRSGDNPDSLRGLNLDSFMIDEAREFKNQNMFDIMIGRIRSSENAQWFIGTTPRGKDWVFDIIASEGLLSAFDTGFASNDHLTVCCQSTFESPFLPLDYIDDCKRKYTSLKAQQELYGKIVEGGGGVISSRWFKRSEYIKPSSGTRYWDLAVTERREKDSGSGSHDPDYSAGALLSILDGIITIHNIIRKQYQYPDIKKLIIETAKSDGKGIKIGIESIGTQKGFAQDIMRDTELQGYTVIMVKSVKDKYNHAMPWAARAEAGTVNICDGSWNQDFFDECDAFTDNDSHPHDDQIDAVSGAYDLEADKRIIIVPDAAVSIIKTEPTDQRFTAVSVNETTIYIVNAVWTGKALYIESDRICTTIEGVIRNLSKNSFNIADEELFSPSLRSLSTAITSKGVPLSEPYDYDALGCQYEVNRLLNEKTLFFSPACSQLTTEIRNLVEIKELTPLVRAFFYIVSTVKSKKKETAQPYKRGGYRKEVKQKRSWQTD